MDAGELGKTYQDGETIIREGEAGDRMYVIQSGRVAVMRRIDGHDVCIAELGKEDVIGEMALFERDSRSATVRALGQVRVLAVDKKVFLRRVHEDPSLAYRILQQMSQRIRLADSELARLRCQVEGDRASTPSPASRRFLLLRKRVDVVRYFLAGLRKPFAGGGSTSAASKAAQERRGKDRRQRDRRQAQRRKGERRSAR